MIYHQEHCGGNVGPWLEVDYEKFDESEVQEKNDRADE